MQSKPAALSAALMPPDLRANRLALGLGMAVFASLSLAAAISSTGFLELDACTHYMIARHALVEHHQLVSVWGRPLCTDLYAIPAVMGGVLGVRVMSLLLALGIALVTYRLAANQGYRWPALAAIGVMAGPVFFLHSFSELTEIPFAFAFVLAFWAYQARQWLLMAILVGILPLGRPEGFGIIALAAVALVAHRRWWWLAVLPLPLVAWQIAGWILWGRPTYYPWLPSWLQWMFWLKANWPYSAASVYGRGYLLHFVALLPILVGPFLFPALWFGIWRSFVEGSLLGDHRRRCQFLIAFIPLFIMVVHSILWWRGLMASNGSIRYLLAVAPLWALLVARGWEWIFERLQWRRPLSWAGVAALAVILANVVYGVVPIRQDADGQISEEVARWYRSDPKLQAEYPRVMATFPLVYLYMDISFGNGQRTAPGGKAGVRALTPGTVLIWEPGCGPANSDQNMCITDKEIEAAGWVFHKELDRGWKIYFSPRKATDPPPAGATGAGVATRPAQPAARPG